MLPRNEINWPTNSLPGLWSGGIACVIAVIATSLALPKFWAYRSDAATSAEAPSGTTSSIIDIA